MLIVGLVAGWLAGEVMAGEGYGIIGDLVVGVLGAFLGGFLAANIFGVADPLSGINIPTLVVAFLGAVVLVAIVRALPGRSPV
jgi:uncharacterized membrane protein YeaQ/YmgE (transglycosylase-associated protein family)